MSFNAYTATKTAYTNEATTAVAAATVVGTAAANKVMTQDVAVGTSLVAVVVMTVKTTSLTLTPKWQVSADGSTWVDLFLPSSTANVASAAGTGAEVVTTRGISAPVTGFKYARMVLVTAGATAHATDDKYSVSYRWIKSGYKN
jgi:hypothetical protein